jgi:tetratricopeptide (TPR) repeat protein
MSGERTKGEGKRYTLIHSGVVAHSVFISYSRSTASADATTLKTALNEAAFLDTSEIETRAEFTRTIAETLLDSRLVVIFADKTYFERPFCRWEPDIILAPFYRGHSGLAHVFVTKPSGRDYCLEPLPPELRSRNWDTKDLSSFLLQIANEPRPRIRDLLEHADCRYLLASSLNDAALPPVRTQLLASIPHWGIGPMSESLQDRFVGRAEALAHLHHELYLHHLGQSSSVALTTAVKATGGIGKTRLALEYIHRYAPQYFSGGIFWIQCESPLEEQFWGILKALDRDTPPINLLRHEGVSIPSLLREKIELVVASAKPVLFVLDNIPESSGVALSLSTFCPALNVASVLVTSRQDQSVNRTIKLDELERMPAWLLLTCDLLQRHLLSDSQWDEISNWVGRLPLALEILNRALYYHAIPLDVLLQRARGASSTPELDQLAAALPDIARGVTATFEISYNALTPSAQKAARLLAELAPEPIPDRLIDTYGSDFGSPATRVELHRHSFVSSSRQAGNVAYFGVMHRVLADYLRTKSNLDDSSSIESLAARNSMVARYVKAASKLNEPHPTVEFLACVLTINLFLKSFVGEPGGASTDNPQSWPLLNAVVPHAMLLMRRSPFATALIGNSIARAAHAQGDLAGARSLLTRVVSVRTQLWGAEDPTTLESMNALGLLMADQGDLAEARSVLQHVVDSGQVAGRLPDSGQISSMQNLATVFTYQGDLNEARRIEQKLVELCVRVLGPDDRKTITAINNLGQTIWQQGDFVVARRLARQVLELRQRVLGPDHPETLQAMDNLAVVERSLGNPVAARGMQSRAVEASRRVLGAEHPQTLDAISNFAQTMAEMGELDAAEALHREVLALKQRLLGPRHRLTLVTMQELATTLFAKGQHELAQEIEEQVLSESRAALGELHPGTLVAINNLALTKQKRGDLAGALKLQEELIEVSRRVHGPDHPSFIGSLNNLGLTYELTGNHRKARGFLKEALESSRRTLGDRHPQTYLAAWNLMHALGALNETPKARRIFNNLVLPLLSEDPASLPGDLREIQLKLRGWTARPGR